MSKGCSGCQVTCGTRGIVMSRSRPMSLVHSVSQCWPSQWEAHGSQVKCVRSTAFAVLCHLPYEALQHHRAGTLATQPSSKSFGACPATDWANEFLSLSFLFWEISIIPPSKAMLTIKRANICKSALKLQSAVTDWRVIFCRALEYRTRTKGTCV